MPEVLLVNPNTDAGTTARMVAIAKAAATGGLTVVGATVSHGVPLITDEAGLTVAAEAVSELFREAGPAADAAIVSAFGDPGLMAARRLTSIPVVGIAEAGMAEAAAAGRRFSVATTTADLAPAIKRCARDYGFGDGLVSVRLTEGDPQIVMSDPERLLTALEAAVRAAIDIDGAEAVVIGGGPLAEAARDLRPLFSVPIIEPVPAAVRRVAALLGDGSPL